MKASLSSSSSSSIPDCPSTSGRRMPLHCQQQQRKNHVSTSSLVTTTATVALMLSIPVVNGMVVTSPGVRSAKTNNNAQMLLNQARALHEQRSTTSTTTSSNKKSKPSTSWSVDNLMKEQMYIQKKNWAEALFDDMTVNLESAIEELQAATGSEIVDSKLQTEIDTGIQKDDASAFLTAHVPEATLLEKVAMSSIPQQLPRPALQAFTQTKKSTLKKSNNNTNKTRKNMVNPKKSVGGSHKKKKIVVTKTTTATATKASSTLRLSKKGKASTTAANTMPKKKEKTTKHNAHLSDLNFSKIRVTPEEEIELAKQIQTGVALHKLKTDYESKHNCEITKKEWTKLAKLSSPTELRKQVLHYRQAKQLLVEANMGLVHAVVKAQYSQSQQHKRTGITQEELIQEGSLGLLRAAELFDPSRGLRFSTYATIWIKGMLSNSHMDETITLPQREKTKWNKICKAHDDIMAENGGSEDTANSVVKNLEEQIASRVGLSVDEVFQMKRKMTQVNSLLSLDYEYKSTQRSGGIDPNASGYSKLETSNVATFAIDVDLAEQTQLRADIVAALAQNLDAREARLMRLRYGLADGQTRSISQCAEAMGLSQSRVQQLAKQCLKKLRQAQNAESLQEYLLTIA